MAVKQISALPPAPNTTEPTTFNDRADAFVGALGRFVDETNALSTQANANAQQVSTDKAQVRADKEQVRADAQQVSTDKAQVRQDAQQARADAQQARADKQAMNALKNKVDLQANLARELDEMLREGIIDDANISSRKTYSSQKINSKIDSTKSELNSKIDRQITSAKSELNSKIDKVSTQRSVALSSAEIDFSLGVDFELTLRANSRLSARNITQNIGKRGLIYINDTSFISGISSDFIRPFHSTAFFKKQELLMHYKINNAGKILLNFYFVPTYKQGTPEANGFMHYYPLRHTSANNLYTIADKINKKNTNTAMFVANKGIYTEKPLTDMSVLFANISGFNDPDISLWDVSNVTDMGEMFYGATNFNQSLNSWDVSNVTNMGGMFYGATNFNQSLNSWDVSNVTNMNQMFYNATNFNQSLSSWDVSNVTNMYEMFYNATSFNQALSSWYPTKISSEPSYFASGSRMTGKPKWGQRKPR